MSKNAGSTSSKRTEENEKSEPVFFLHVRARLFWDPFFRDAKRKLSACEIINLSVSGKADALLRVMRRKGAKWAQKRVRAWDQLLREADKHNSVVSKIQELSKKFSRSLVLGDPSCLDDEAGPELEKEKALYASFEKLREEQRERLKEIDDLLSNVETIQKQFELFRKLKQLQSLSLRGFAYIDFETADSIHAEEDEIIQKSRGFEKAYYPFAKDPDLDKKIQERNRSWIAKNSEDPLFDDIGGRSLDREQRSAILKEEKASLVIAGAGSGKTLTICGKVKYLLERKNVPPEEILLLSYSRKSAEDLAKKMAPISPALQVGTFHGVGLEILNKKQGRPYIVEDQFAAIVESYFREELPKRPAMEQTFLIYYSLFLSDEARQKKYRDEGELYLDMKKMDYVTLKNMAQEQRGLETFKKEKVKSYEELAIANWYFLNGVEYVYEAPYRYDVGDSNHRQYKPDFYLKDYGVYHEHYGIGKDGKALQYGPEKSREYVDGIRWKRNVHLVHETDCIETYSYEMKEGTLFDRLQAELDKRGIKTKPLDEQTRKDVLHSIYHGYPFASFIGLMKSFLSLYKSRYRDASSFSELEAEPSGNKYMRTRKKLFLSLARDVYEYYTEGLRKAGKIDFDDMILKSMETLDGTYDFRFRYIIVDEFQDISISRAKFLQKLIEHGRSNIFAVGDDWQSIYRFSGSDLDIFIHFSSYFGRSALSFINTTHRNSQELQDIVGPFIKANPEQIDKSVHSDIHLPHPVKTMFVDGRPSQSFLGVLEDIAKEDEHARVLVLGRNKKDVQDILSDGTVSLKRPKEEGAMATIVAREHPGMVLRFSTVHGSKGLEEDYVVLLHANDERLGFPNKTEDDALLNLVLSKSSDYLFAEERRLWYVALTRTRKYTYILADRNKPSIFLEEILPECLIMNPKESEKENEEKKCPKCHSGNLILRRDRQGKPYYGCSNYPYCDYAIRDIHAVDSGHRCPVCGDYLILRKGKYGPFYGCHSYPYCEHTEKMEPDSAPKRY